VSSLFTDDCRYYLARQAGPMSLELVDGCHGDPAGVAKAAKLHGHIFGSEGPWIMVELRPVPDIDVQIDEDAAATCAALVKGAHL
jgi:hypothetical protein